jgi:hypothetical protein
MSENQTAAFKPLLFVELLDRSFRLYRGNFWQFIGILAIMEIPLQLLSLVFNLVNSTSMLDQMQNPAFFRAGDYSPIWTYFITTFSGSCVIGLATLVLLRAVACGTLTNAIFHAHLGEPMGIRAAYRSIRPFLTRLIVVVLLGAVIIIAMMVWMIVPCIGWISGFGMLVYFSWVLEQLVIPVVIMEHKSGWAAFQRAWQLARRRFWWVLGFVGSLTLVSYVVSIGPAYLVATILNLADKAFALSETVSFVLRTSVNSLVGLITSLIYLPLLQTGIALLYLDLRVRTEGLDLIMQLQAPDESVEGKMTALAVVQTPEPPSLMTKKEFGYVALLSFGAFLLFAGLYLVIFLIALLIGLGLGGLT